MALLEEDSRDGTIGNGISILEHGMRFKKVMKNRDSSNRSDVERHNRPRLLLEANVQKA